MHENGRGRAIVNAGLSARSRGGAVSPPSRRLQSFGTFALAINLRALGLSQQREAIMTTALAYGHALRTRAPTRLATEVIVLGLWAAAGLALTGVAFALGFGAELTQALAAAG